MTSLFRLLIISVLFISTSSFAFLPPEQSINNGFIDNEYTDETLTDKALSRFIVSHLDLTDHSLCGVYVKDKMLLPVFQQPEGNAAYVSPKRNAITEFSLAREFGSVGLLAHNDLSGKKIAEIEQGDEIILIYADGTITEYLVKEIRIYQALSPDNPYSSFLDTSNPGNELSASEMFMQTYGQSGRLVLQTCIEQNGIKSWGRLFVISTSQ